MGAGADDRIKHPAAVAGAVGCAVGVLSSCRGWCSFLLSGLVFFPPVGAGVPGRRGGGCWCSCRGLFAFYTLPCLVFLPIIWKNSSRAAAGVRFLLKKRTKKRKHGNV